MDTRPTCVIVTGRPGSGKTTLSKQLAARRQLQRGLEDPRRELYHGDSRVSLYRRTGELAPPDPYEEPKLGIPTMHVRREDGYSPTLEAIVSWVQQPGAQTERTPEDAAHHRLDRRSARVRDGSVTHRARR